MEGSLITGLVTPTLTLPPSGGGNSTAQSSSSVDQKKFEAAARDFEAMFMAEMIRPMFEMTDVDPVFGGGKGEEIFRGILADEYGKIMAAQGGIGLASPVARALLDAQSAQTSSARR